METIPVTNHPRHFADSVRAWFLEHTCGGLILPTGWLGRPFDNMHTLTEVSDSDGVLCITFDRYQRLEFHGLRSVVVEDDQLVLGPFERLETRIHSYGHPEVAPKCSEFESGEVRFVRLF